MPYYYNNYICNKSDTNIGIDEAVAYMIESTNNAIHEFEMGIVLSEYKYLRDYGHEMPLNEGVIDVKSLWNKLSRKIKEFFRNATTKLAAYLTKLENKISEKQIPGLISRFKALPAKEQHADSMKVKGCLLVRPRDLMNLMGELINKIENEESVNSIDFTAVEHDQYVVYNLGSDEGSGPTKNKETLINSETIQIAADTITTLNPSYLLDIYRKISKICQSKFQNINDATEFLEKKIGKILAGVFKLVGITLIAVGESCQFIFAAHRAISMAESRASKGDK